MVVHKFVVYKIHFFASTVITMNKLCTDLLERIAHMIDDINDVNAFYIALDITYVRCAIFDVRAVCRRLNVTFSCKAPQLRLRAHRSVLHVLCAYEHQTTPTSLEYLLNLWAARGVLSISAATDNVYNVDHYKKMHAVVEMARMVAQPTETDPLWMCLSARTGGFLKGLVQAVTNNWTSFSVAAQSMAASLRHGFTPDACFATRGDQLLASLCIAGVNLRRVGLRDPRLRSDCWWGWSRLMADLSSDRCSVAALFVGAVVLGGSCMDELKAAIDCAVRHSVRPSWVDTVQLLEDTATVSRLLRFVRKRKRVNAERVAAYLAERGLVVCKPSQCIAVLELMAEFMLRGTPTLFKIAATVYMELTVYDVPTAHVIKFVCAKEAAALPVIRDLVKTGLFTARPCADPAHVLNFLSEHGIAAFDSVCIQVIADHTLSTEHAFSIVGDTRRAHEIARSI